jgi:hypothetical protein
MLILGLIWASNAQQPRRGVRQVTASGPVELTVELSKTTAMVAEPIDLLIQVDAPIATQITMPPVGDSIGDFSVLETKTVAEVPVTGKAGLRRWVTAMQIEAIETGDQRIPAFEILFPLPTSLNNGSTLREGSIRSEPMSVQIVSVLVGEEDPNQFRDLKDPADAPTAKVRRSFLPWVLGGGALGVSATVCLLMWTRHGRRPKPKKWALEAVKRIESEYQAKSIGIDQVYTQLSSVIRGFLEDSLAIPATSQSSDELVMELATVAIADSAKQQLIRFLTEADELKFSGSQRWSRQIDEPPFDSIRRMIQECHLSAEMCRHQCRSAEKIDNVNS